MSISLDELRKKLLERFNSPVPRRPLDGTPFLVNNMIDFIETHRALGMPDETIIKISQMAGHDPDEVGHCLGDYTKYQDFNDM